MKRYFYARNGEKIGPFDYEELCKENITPDTLVWRDGMDDWQRAGNLEELIVLFSENPADVPPLVPADAGFITIENQKTAPKDVDNTNPVQLPKTWLVESILVTIFCCLPFGIPGIVYASKVESRFYAGDPSGAQEASKKARRWTIYSFIAGIIYIVIALIYGIATGFSDF